ncbi:hypothetical protein LCGC14_1938700, partial [marine sediment metagenome]
KMVTKVLERPSGEQVETKVDFRTGAVAVDFDFTRRVRVANSTILTPTTEMLYLDSEGVLCWRTRYHDEAGVSKEREALEGRVGVR